MGSKKKYLASVGLRLIRGEKWVQTRCLDPSMLGFGHAPKPKHVDEVLGVRPALTQASCPSLGSLGVGLLLYFELGIGSPSPLSMGLLLYLEFGISSPSLEGILVGSILREFFRVLVPFYFDVSHINHKLLKYSTMTLHNLFLGFNWLARNIPIT